MLYIMGRASAALSGDAEPASLRRARRRRRLRVSAGEG